MDDQGGRVERRGLGELEDAGLAAQRAADGLLDVAQERRALALGQPRVDRHDRRAEQQAAVQRLDERQAGVEREADRDAAAHAAHVQRPGRADRAQQQLAVRDRFARVLDRDPVGTAPGGAREPVSEVHVVERRG